MMIQSDLQNYERLNLADALVPKMYSKDEQIIKQGTHTCLGFKFSVSDHSVGLCACTGDAADGMYFIEDGSVSIRLEQDGDEGEVEISVLNKGQYFGELALVTHRPRAASAYATTDIKVACK